MALPLNLENLEEAPSPVIQPFRIAGRVGRLSGRALLNVPASLKYRSVIANHISDVAVGSGAYIVGAGAVIVIVVMTAVVGIQTSLEGTKGLELIGAQDLVGFVSAYASIREIAPLIAGVIFAAQIGAQFTAELGAMRISNEIDAIEVMGLPSMRYLVSTRLIASMVDRKSTRLNSSHANISYAVFCLKKKKIKIQGCISCLSSHEVTWVHWSCNQLGF